MESLLKLSGLLNGEDGDRTDLGSLEKKLADNNYGKSNGGTPTRAPDHSSNSQDQPQMFETPRDTPQQDHRPTPQTSKRSPGRTPGEGAEVEEISDMMCSLVTNNCGESRYLGLSFLAQSTRTPNSH